MRVAVVIEQLPGTRHRASSEQFGIAADSVTRSHAISELRALIQERIADGLEVVEFEARVRDDAWQGMAGVFADDSLYDEWRKVIEEYRDRTSHGGIGA